jgi:hypothetical protein
VGAFQMSSFGAVLSNMHRFRTPFPLSFILCLPVVEIGSHDHATLDRIECRHYTHISEVGEPHA